MTEVKRILVLCPDPVSAGSMKRILEAEGFEVHVESSPGAALNRIGEKGMDLLITEVRMPERNGFDVLHDIRDTFPALDVIMVTDEPSKDEAGTAKRLGALEYIGRPFAPEFLLQSVRGAFERQGWIVRKEYIEQFKQYLTSPGQMDETSVYYKEGLWARPVDGGLWEIGVDVRHFYLEGQLLYLESLEVPELRKGEPFARLTLGEGPVRDLNAPMGGEVAERNPRVNETMCNLARECLTENWMLWLVRIKPTS